MDGSDRPNPTTEPAPAKPKRKIHAAWIFLPLLLVAVIVAIVNGSDGDDRTPTEQEFLAHQDSTLDDDEALRYGDAACDLIESGGQQLTIEWLAGTDAFSRAGYVKPNPDPISIFDARQVTEAADAYLCDR